MNINKEKDKLQEEILAAFRKNNYNGIALSPTGTGKAKVMIDIIKELKPKTILYLCDSVELRDKTFKHELRKWGVDHNNTASFSIEFMCYQSALKLSGKHYNLVLGDEFDAALTPKRIKVFENNTFDHKVLVSATLEEDKRRLAKKIAPIIFERNLVTVIEDGVLNKINFYFVNYDLSLIENGQYLNYNYQFKKLLNQVQNSGTKSRLEMLQIQRKQYLSSLNSSRNVCKWIIDGLKSKSDDKILIFCGLSSQADKICKYSFHSGNQDKKYLEAFDEGIIRELAVVDKVNRGLNIDQIRNILFESVGKSKTKLMQRIGRGTRLEIHEALSVFILIPYFMNTWGERKATIVQTWIMESLKDFSLKDAKIINYKPNI